MMDELMTALANTKIPFKEYGWDISPDAPYGVVSLEGSGDTVPGDGRILHQSLRGSIDLYVRSSSLDMMKAVQDAINGVVAWRLNAIQLEEDTRLVHYEWIFEMELM